MKTLNEATEVSELSKKTLGNYIKTASADAADHAQDVGKHYANNAGTKGANSYGNREKRRKGVNMAVNKLAGTKNEANDNDIDKIKQKIAKHQAEHDHHHQSAKEAGSKAIEAKHSSAKQHHADQMKKAKERLVKMQNESAVNESQSAAVKKALAKASASSEKGKDAVTLPRAPWDKKKDESLDYNPAKGEYNQPKGKEVGKRVGTREAADPDTVRMMKDNPRMMNQKGPGGLKSLNKNSQKAVKKAVNNESNEGLKGDQHKLDHNKDGKISGTDFKGLRKKNEKSTGKNNQETGNVNVKMDTSKSNKSSSPMETKESTVRERLMSIWEKAGDKHTKSGTPSEPHGQYDSPGGKQMKADMKAQGDHHVNDTEKLGHDDAAKAGRSGPTATKRPNDGKLGDKTIINRVAAAYKEMNSGN